MPVGQSLDSKRSNQAKRSQSNHRFKREERRKQAPDIIITIFTKIKMIAISRFYNIVQPLYSLVPNLPSPVLNLKNKWNQNGNSVSTQLFNENTRDDEQTRTTVCCRTLWFMKNASSFMLPSFNSETLCSWFYQSYPSFLSSFFLLSLFLPSFFPVVTDLTWYYCSIYWYDPITTFSNIVQP